MGGGGRREEKEKEGKREGGRKRDPVSNKVEIKDYGTEVVL